MTEKQAEGPKEKKGGEKKILSGAKLRKRQTRHI